MLNKINNCKLFIFVLVSSLFKQELINMSESRPSNVKETALGKWLRAATSEDQNALARMLGRTSIYYLRVLAGVHRENPRLRLALAIVHGIAVLNQRAKHANPPRIYPVVSLADLASPTRKEDPDTVAIETFAKD